MLNQQRKEHIEKRMRQIRQVANEISLRKLRKLDYGDKSIVVEMVDNIYRDLHRLRLIADSGCSQLLELLEYQGADLSAPE